jgi:hypothetical protein
MAGQNVTETKKELRQRKRRENERESKNGERRQDRKPRN